jgi:peptidoglycan/LPS O-acetylase OafA/YrhL
MTSNPAAGHNRIADIELLRGIAIIFVLIEHVRINLFTWMSGQDMRLYFYFGFWSGVDLFFAVSGFVIARSLLRTLNPNASPLEFFNAAVVFWVRRAWRLLPSAWLWLGIILLAVVFTNRSGAFGTFRANFEGAIAGIMEVANFRTLVVFGRFEAGASFPYWSLSLEEQFYILLPFVILLTRRWLPHVLAVCVVAQLFVTRSGQETSPVGMVMNQLRSDAILLGVLIAIWCRHPTYRLFEPVLLHRLPLLGTAVCAMLVFCLAAVGSRELHLITFQVGVVAVISAALVWIASFDRDYLAPDSVVKRLLIWIGSRSYAFYIAHIPIFLLTREIWFRIEPAGTVFNSTFSLRYGLTAAILLVATADLNYRFVEVPLRRRGAGIARRLALRTQ